MKKINLFFALCLAAAAASCAKVEFTQPEEALGSLQMSMYFDEATKAMSEEDLLNTAQVNIYYSDYSGLVRSYAYSNMPSPFYLTAGDYRVDVLAGESVADSPAPASWENKSYKGSAEFTIVEGESQSVKVVASVNNAVTNVTFDQTVGENLNPDYTLTICLDPEDPTTKLVYTADKSGTDGYFIVYGRVLPSFTWSFEGTLAKDGTPVVKAGVVENIEQGKLYKMGLRYTIKDGEIDFTLMVDTTTDEFDDTIIFEPKTTGLSATPEHEIWAAHTTLYADIDATDYVDPKVQFAYSADGADWEFVDGVNFSEGSWKADISKLTPETEYTYKLFINDEETGDPLTFTTDAAPKLPNGDFEYASKVSGNNYYKFYDPNCGVEEGMTMFWGSGNGEGPDGINGSANMGIIITEVSTDIPSGVKGKQSIKLHTSAMAGMLAAGNLFTGQFMGLVGTEGGIVDFGRPWTSRPTALKIWCKYNTGKIDILNDKNLGVSKNDYDRAQIKVAIGTWAYRTYGGSKDNPVRVNTTKKSTFVDFYTDPSTIANGDIIIYNDGYSINKGAKVTANTAGWIEYVIPLEYHNLTTMPTHIIISCAASQFGDYFTGYNGSDLWVDAAELIYE